MFSSEQIFEVSGDMDQLEMAIKFAIEMYETGRASVVYQITKDGKYCLGWGNQEGWNKFPFDFDAHIVSEIVKQHLNKQKYENLYAWSDGTSEKGFLMKVIHTSAMNEDGIKNPFFGIVSIEPFMNYYAK
jgi:hypothetical protein